MWARLLAVSVAAALHFPSAFAAIAASSTPDVAAERFSVSDPSLVQFAGGPSVKEPEKMQKQWRGEATIEVYMASGDLNNVGYVAGPMMYDLIQRTLKKDCPDTIGGNSYSHSECSGKRHSFDTRYRKDDGTVAATQNHINVKSSKYKNTQVRNLLIGAIAAVYEESTKLARNCFFTLDPEADYRYCNAPIRVGAYTEDSHILIDLVSDVSNENDGGWHCCETREFIDKRLDELMGEFKSVYPTPRTLPKLAECHLGCTLDQREFTTHVDKILIDMMISGL